MKIRLQKRMAEAGLCSRREAEQWILAGRVKVNGEMVKVLGTQVDEMDNIQVDNKELSDKAESLTIALNKPKGYLSSTYDPHHEKTVLSLLPQKFQSLKPVGRLDLDTEGLLLLSNDGALIQTLSHPRHGHKKTYHVLLRGQAEEKDLRPLKSGRLTLDGHSLNPMEFKILSVENKKTRIELTLTEGRKRQIRRVMKGLGFSVLHLKRVAIGELQLSKLGIPKPGDYKILSSKEIDLALFFRPEA